MKEYLKIYFKVFFTLLAWVVGIVGIAYVVGWSILNYPMQSGIVGITIVIAVGIHCVTMSIIQENNRTSDDYF